MAGGEGGRQGVLHHRGGILVQGDRDIPGMSSIGWDIIYTCTLYSRVGYTMYGTLYRDEFCNWKYTPFPYLSCTLYLSRLLILVDIFCANQSESKFLSLPLKSCQNVSQGNQSFSFNKRKI